jgi:hypothetical protein
MDNWITMENDNRCHADPRKSCCPSGIGPEAEVAAGTMSIHKARIAFKEGGALFGTKMN